MKIFVTAIMYFLLIGTVCMPGKSFAKDVVSDEVAITEAVLNYAEGWYLGDVARIEKVLHPQLAKRGLQFSEAGEPSLHILTDKQLVASAAERKGQSMPEGTKLKVSILDVYEDIATVKLDSPWFADYIHLTKWNGEWLIINVLWESWK